MRAFFLSILFPRIITSGRLFLSSRTARAPAPVQAPRSLVADEALADESTDQPLLPHASGPASASPSPSQSHLPSESEGMYGTDAGSRFDLYFLQFSILLDGLLTATVTLANQGWEMYLAAAVLPFASGTGSAVKGVVMDLVGPDEKADALSAIALVEKLGEWGALAPGVNGTGGMTDNAHSASVDNLIIRVCLLGIVGDWYADCCLSGQWCRFRGDHRVSPSRESRRLLTGPIGHRPNGICPAPMCAYAKDWAYSAGMTKHELYGRSGGLLIG